MSSKIDWLEVRPNLRDERKLWPSWCVDDGLAMPQSWFADLGRGRAGFVRLRFMVECLMAADIRDAMKHNGAGNGLRMEVPWAYLIPRVWPSSARITPSLAVKTLMRPSPDTPAVRFPDGKPPRISLSRAAGGIVSALPHSKGVTLLVRTVAPEKRWPMMPDELRGLHKDPNAYRLLLNWRASRDGLHRPSKGRSWRWVSDPAKYPKASPRDILRMADPNASAKSELRPRDAAAALARLVEKGLMGVVDGRLVPAVVANKPTKQEG